MAELQVTERSATLDDQPCFWLAADAGDGRAPVVYVHGVPTSADDWRPFLAATGGVAPDLPGFGRSGKRGDLAFDMPFYADWLLRFLDARGIDRCRLVVHDWGGVGLVAAQRAPERVERLVIIDAVPLLGGYRWHRLARAWRTPILGEVVMGLTTRWTLRLLSREANATPGPLPGELLDAVWAHFDQGTQRAILRLYRSAPPAALEAAGRDLGRLTCPALVVWGARDPYVPAVMAHRYAAALPDATARVVDDAGHWPWLDRPELVGEIAAFLAG